jgi:hypothetical protein
MAQHADLGGIPSLELFTLEGLAWRPRHAGTGWSYVFFGDRFVAGGLKAESTPTIVDSGPDTPRSTKSPSRPESDHRIQISRMSQTLAIAKMTSSLRWPCPQNAYLLTGRARGILIPVVVGVAVGARVFRRSQTSLAMPHYLQASEFCTVIERWVGTRR